MITLINPITARMTWSSLKSAGTPPSARAGAVSAVVKQRAYVFGGVSDQESELDLVAGDITRYNTSLSLYEYGVCVSLLFLSICIYILPVVFMRIYVKANILMIFIISRVGPVVGLLSLLQIIKIIKTTLGRLRGLAPPLGARRLLRRKARVYMRMVVLLNKLEIVKIKNVCMYICHMSHYSSTSLSCFHSTTLF